MAGDALLPEFDEIQIPRRAAAGSLLLRAVLESLPCYLADACALVLRRHLPRLVKIGRGQQAVGEQEVHEIAGMTTLLPDQALQQLLVVGYGTLSAQVQGDHHGDHRHRLRGGQAEDELLVVVSHREPRGHVPVEVAAYSGHRVFAGLAAPPHDGPGPGRQLLAVGRDRWLGGPAAGLIEPQPPHPRTPPDPPRTLPERDRQRPPAGRGGPPGLARPPLPR